MAQYPQQNFNAMRQDAIRRSREMQRRAVPPSSPPAPEPLPVPPASPSTGILPKELQHLLTDWDSERLILLALLYILYKEGADHKLLLAIAYIML